jgi:hypothetical protein
MYLREHHSPNVYSGFMHRSSSRKAKNSRRKNLSSLPSGQAEALGVRQQRALLLLNQLALGPAEAVVLVLVDLVKCIAQLPHDVKLVVEDRRLWRVSASRVLERLSHLGEKANRLQIRT